MPAKQPTSKKALPVKKAVAKRAAPRKPPTERPPTTQARSTASNAANGTPPRMESIEDTEQRKRELLKQTPVPMRFTVALVIVSIVMVLVLVGLPYSLNASNNTDAINSGTKIQGCRSQYGAAVTQARTQLDLALGESAAVQDSFFGGLATPAATFARLGPQFLAVQKRLDAAAKAEETANDRYQTTTALSNTDSHDFLVKCMQDFPALVIHPVTSTTRPA